ncbi:hypothetical protein CCO03_06535 [Comamonas serinivorans]|uniref:N-methyl-D-aspartate receptor NMDAR2C subunit n=1 Tax=Comamonas serinivorans TaxID=1082851 RepID=A0A1Y0ELC9_9BURK|nr:hypothetical protein [Comamonas serinivorans]ARU04376.1 hypothetical protein CCO03_06535 [Comamonas serinivorans]
MNDACFTPARWLRLCDALAVPPAHAARTRFADLQAAYAEPQRHYHTAQHIGECLTLLDGVRDLPQGADAARPGKARPGAAQPGAALNDPALIEAALWLHDVVYDPQAKTNEAQSAALAAHWLAGALSEARLQRLCRWIAATQHHDAAPDDADLQALLDIDLAILAAPPARFAEYEAQVAREYAHVPADLFRQGRRAFLLSLGQRPRLYHHPAFLALEVPARRNLAAAVAG